jgi:hypothetical protein
MPIFDAEKRREYDREWSRKKRQENPEYFLWKSAKKEQGTKV